MRRTSGAASLLLAVAVAVASVAAPAAQAGTAERSNAVVERRVIGQSVQDRPIVAYRKGNPDAERTVLILGQMHGDERAGVRTARYVKRHVPVSLRADVWIVPTMNPDGLAARTRQNARGVDLNRNWPMNWEPGPRGPYYPGRRAASEPETRAMLAFLEEQQPDLIASIHQPFGVVASNDKAKQYVRRLSEQLDLPIEYVGVGGCDDPDCPPPPTMTSWYNHNQPGKSVTIEFVAKPTKRFVTVKAGRGILRASFAY